MTGLRSTLDREPNNHDAVYENLRAALIEHEFKLGEHLMISDLATRYGVSPTPVREALSRLREEMLVTFVPGKGFFCRTPDLKELTDLYQTLKALLIFAVSAAPGGPTGCKIGRTVSTLSARRRMATMPRAAAAVARTDLVENTVCQIVELTGNKVISRVAGNVIARTHKARLIDMESLDSFQSFSDVLWNVREAIRRNDRATTEQLIEAEFEKKIGNLPNLIREIIVRRYIFEEMEATENERV